MRLGLGEIASAMSAAGDVPQDMDCEVLCVQTDSRLVRPGDLFVCIAGKNMDGHGFAAEAAKKGACGIVAHTPITDLTPAVPVLLVRDTLQALGRLALYWRSKTKATVIAVTGSAGKTTVREMLASVLGCEGKTAKNAKNWNNQLGLPLSMLACSGEERFWVMELGISRPGDMEELGTILQPDHVLITNAGPCHLEGLGDVQGVARAKAMLCEFMTSGGQVVASRDYHELYEEVRARAAQPVFFSIHEPSSDYYATFLGKNDAGMGRFLFTLNGASQEVLLPMHGQDMAENTIAVAAMARCLGLETATIMQGLKQYVPVARRFNVSQHGSWTVIDDTYNANPLSMQRAIERAGELCPDKPLVLVLGEMKELGEYAHQGHANMGSWAGKSPCSLLFFVGDHADSVRSGLCTEEMPDAFEERFIPLDTPEAFSNMLHRLPAEGTILFKGSRSCQMEKYLNVFLEGVG